MLVTYKVKATFFDRPAVLRATDAVTRRALSRIGAFVRRRARSSLRRRKKVSAPGQPPSVHTADAVATLKNILFAYDRHNQSVIIGPVKLNLHQLQGPLGPGGRAVGPGGGIPTKGTVPETLEFGGYVGVREVMDANGRWQKTTWRRRRFGTRKVPVWKVTEQEKRSALGTERVFVPGRKKTRLARGAGGRFKSVEYETAGRTIVFYIIPDAVQQRIAFKKIAARPFMGPALEKEIPQIPEQWSYAIGGGRAA